MNSSGTSKSNSAKVFQQRTGSASRGLGVNPHAQKLAVITNAAVLHLRARKCGGVEYREWHIVHRAERNGERAIVGQEAIRVNSSGNTRDGLGRQHSAIRSAEKYRRALRRQ